MLYNNIHILAPYLPIIDAVTLAGGMLLGWITGLQFQIWDDSLRPPAVLFAVLVAFAFMTIANALRAYRPRRIEPTTKELRALLGASICAAGLACLLLEVLTMGLPGPAYLVCTASGLLVLLTIRIVIRSGLRALRLNGRDNRTWLVVGWNERSRRMVHHIHTHPHFGIYVGKLIDFPRPEGAGNGSGEEARNPPPDGIPLQIIREAGEFRDVILESYFDEVVVCLPIRSCYDQVSEISKMCTEAGITTSLMSEMLTRLTNERSDIVRIDGEWLITRFSGPERPGSLMAKRALDTVVAALGLIAMLPVHIVISILIKMTSPGPVFFRQVRVGLHGRPFQMIKYRTMVANASDQYKKLRAHNETDGPAFKIRKDPRITPVGRFLRKYHMDELPQLWNVLLGNMSLVGPRPLTPEENDGTAWWHRRRLSMPPGLTCSWQIKGDHRISFDTWMKLDIEYIEHWSLTRDFRLLLSTVKTIARGTGW